MVFVKLCRTKEDYDACRARGQSAVLVTPELIERTKCRLENPVDLFRAGITVEMILASGMRDPIDGKLLSQSVLIALNMRCILVDFTGTSTTFIIKAEDLKNITHLTVSADIIEKRGYHVVVQAMCDAYSVTISDKAEKLEIRK